MGQEYQWIENKEAFKGCGFQGSPSLGGGGLGEVLFFYVPLMNHSEIDNIHKIPA